LIKIDQGQSFKNCLYRFLTRSSLRFSIVILNILVAVVV